MMLYLVLFMYIQYRTVLISMYYSSIVSDAVLDLYVVPVYMCSISRVHTIIMYVVGRSVLPLFPECNSSTCVITVVHIVCTFNNLAQLPLLATTSAPSIKSMTCYQTPPCIVLRPQRRNMTYY